MPVRLRSVTFDAPDPARPAQFWAGLLGRTVLDDAGGLLLPGDDTQLGLRFFPGPAGETGQNLMHLHLTTSDLADQQRIVATAVDRGAGHLDVGQRPEDGHVVLADPAGYEFCVIEPGNAYLAGTGFLGELACDGTRQVGMFWSEALGWPLVWDDNEETAIQSPRGGTKIAWGGGPLTPSASPGRQRFDLVAVDATPAVEVKRLVSLGATDHGAGILTDPDGAEFHLSFTPEDHPGPALG